MAIITNTTYLEKLCSEQMLRYIDGIGDWVRFPDTIHEGLAHLAETIGLLHYKSYAHNYYW